MSEMVNSDHGDALVTSRLRAPASAEGMKSPPAWTLGERRQIAGAGGSISEE